MHRFYPFDAFKLKFVQEFRSYRKKGFCFLLEHKNIIIIQQTLFKDLEVLVQIVADIQKSLLQTRN